MANQYDLIKVELGGNIYAMPKKAAMMLFDILSTQEVWKLDTWWSSNYSDNKMIAKLIDPVDHIKLQGLNPVQFHAAVEAQRVKEEMERAKEAEKAKVATNA